MSSHNCLHKGLNIAPSNQLVFKHSLWSSATTLWQCPRQLAQKEGAGGGGLPASLALPAMPHFTVIT